MSEIEQFTDRRGHQWVVLPGPKYIDGNSGQKLLDLSLLLLDKGANHLALNMADTHVVNSVGFSRLIELVEAYGQHGGAVAFCTTNPLIVKTLRMMGLMTKATLYGSVQEVAASSTGSAQRE